MISVYATKVEAVDEDNTVLFTLEMQDEHCCVMTLACSLLLSNKNLEETLEAVRSSVKILNLTNN
jgi:hypothetical protein